jgi:uncharacterized protein
MIRPCALLLMAAGAAGMLFGRGQGGDRFLKVYLPDGRSVTAELAVTDAQRARGLMNREKILPDQGMLFVFEEEAGHSFWMKNTLVPLDMLWLDRDRRIIHIAPDVPPCQSDPCPSYGPGRPSLYVLELKGGMAAVFGLKVYDKLDFVLPRRK